MNTNKQSTKKHFNKRNLKVEKLAETLGNTHINLINIVKNNAEIRRFTALRIIGHLKYNNNIPSDAKCYVTFYLEKFAVAVNGLKTEYRYEEQFFIDSLVESFTDLGNYAGRVINEFIKSISDDTNSPVEEETTTATNNSDEESNSEE